MPISELERRTELTPDKIYLRQPVDGQVKDFTWSGVFDQVRRLAGGFQSLGLKPGDRIALMAKNCAEWFITDWAIMAAGMISVPIYPTAGEKTIRHVLSHSESKLLIIGKLDSTDALSNVLNDSGELALQTLSMPYPTVMTKLQWYKFLDASAPIESLNDPDENDVMSIIYTSGSTGTPKGVVMSFGAYHYASKQTQDTLGVTESDRVVSYLPLAHITERGVIEGPSLYAGCTVYFVESLDTFIFDINRAQPTFFLSVPRLWSKFLSNIHARVTPKKLSILLSLPVIGNLVARKIRRTLGLDQVRVFGSGSAPISPEILKWYKRLGMNISEGWGMTETGGLSCSNLPFDEARIGTIGVPLDGTEMKISEQGEVLISSPGLFQEYYQDPALTEESFTEDGFFKTGDKGEYNEALNAFRITGRVKELFKTEKGKYIAPVPIESKLAVNDLFEQICVMGTLLPQPIAVTVLSPAAESLSNEKIEASINQTLESINAQLEPHERLSGVFVAKDEWTIENELLTPTLKIKRGDIEQAYLPKLRMMTGKTVCWEA
ncbi:AMP-binding protein [Corallincola platygyrae]